MKNIWKWFLKKMRLRFCKETKKFYLKAKEDLVRPLDVYLGV